MDWHDRPRIGRNRCFQARGIQVVGTRVRLHKNRRGPYVGHGQCRGDIRIGRDDDLVAGPYVQGAQGQVQGVQAVAQPHTEPGLVKCGIGFLKSRYLFAQYEPAPIVHPLKGLLHLCADSRVHGAEI